MNWTELYCTHITVNSPGFINLSFILQFVAYIHLRCLVVNYTLGSLWRAMLYNSQDSEALRGSLLMPKLMFKTQTPALGFFTPYPGSCFYVPQLPPRPSPTQVWRIPEVSARANTPSNSTLWAGANSAWSCVHFQGCDCRIFQPRQKASNLSSITVVASSLWTQWSDMFGNARVFLMEPRA